MQLSNGRHTGVSSFSRHGKGTAKGTTTARQRDYEARGLKQAK